MEVASALGVVIGIMAAVAGVLFGFLQERQKRRQAEETLEKRVGRLTASLSDAVRLIDEVQGEIEARQKLVEKLEKDAETYEQIAQLRQAEVEAVAQVLRGELRKEGGRSLRQTLGINSLFFLSGAGVSVAITLALT